MSSSRMAKNCCPGVVEARFGRCRLTDVTSREADVLKCSRPTAAGVSNPPVFDIARDYSFGGEGGAEMTDVRQVKARLPETTMDNKENGERTLALWEAKLSELLGVTAVRHLDVEGRW